MVSIRVIFKWFQIGLKLQNCNDVIKYQTNFDNPISLNKCDWYNSFEKSAMLLRIIGSLKEILEC